MIELAAALLFESDNCYDWEVHATFEHAAAISIILPDEQADYLTSVTIDDTFFAYTVLKLVGPCAGYTRVGVFCPGGGCQDPFDGLAFTMHFTRSTALEVDDCGTGTDIWRGDVPNTLWGAEVEVETCFNWRGQFGLDYVSQPWHTILMATSQEYNDLMSPLTNCAETAIMTCGEGQVCCLCVYEESCSFSCRDAQGECDPCPPCGDPKKEAY